MKIRVTTPIGDTYECEATKEHTLLMIESGDSIKVLEALPHEWQHLTTSPAGLLVAKG